MNLLCTILLTFLLSYQAFVNAMDDIEFKRTSQTGGEKRFETTDLTASDDESEEKRGFLSANCHETCQSGTVKSKYCTTFANKCFGGGQKVWVKFGTPYRKAPNVMIGLTLVDTHKDQNVRVRTSVTRVTTDGFELLFNPWFYSITYQIGVNWMACP